MKTGDLGGENGGFGGTSKFWGENGGFLEGLRNFGAEMGDFGGGASKF